MLPPRIDHEAALAAWHDCRAQASGARRHPWQARRAVGGVAISGSPAQHCVCAACRAGAALARGASEFCRCDGQLSNPPRNFCTARV